MLSINKYIQENSIIKINEKNKYGEVFTPQSQIDIMLDTLPKHIPDPEKYDATELISSNWY